MIIGRQHNSWVAMFEDDELELASSLGLHTGESHPLPWDTNADASTVSSWCRGRYNVTKVSFKEVSQ